MKEKTAAVRNRREKEREVMDLMEDSI